ncbi:hypothetical protein SEA_HANNACONDA_128 [Mycobacterium phage Hannaconda]|nr:hypothetical protein SEA_HANNACONDA_128 [Mycobacterium phage Hannaconda]QPO16737.1 hypothetical protein SEA_KASHFLOW_133 [Mycobacterium phage KashFlow]
MSLSKPHTSNSPVRRWFKIKGTKGGGITYWDKSAEAEREVATPFHFVVLDTLNAISGFHKPSNTGIRSNEIRDTRNERLVVRAGATVLAEGLYNDIKDVMKGKGGKFANSVYIAFKDGDDLAIGNILLAGAALSEFFDFKKGKNLDNEPGVAITGFDGPHLSGTNEYWKPVFGSWTPSDLNSAIALDETLQAYLDGSGQPEESAAPSGGYSQPEEPSSPWDDSEPPF